MRARPKEATLEGPLPEGGSHEKDPDRDRRLAVRAGGGRLRPRARGRAARGRDVRAGRARRSTSCRPAASASRRPLPHEVTDEEYEPLERAREQAEEVGVAAHARLLRGGAVDEIVAYADTIDADLIVIGSRGHGAVASALLGSVSRGVLARGAPAGARRARYRGTAACLRHRLTCAENPQREPGSPAASSRLATDGAWGGRAQTPPIRSSGQSLGRDGRRERCARFFEIGGIVAAVILIAFGIASIVMGFNGRDTVHDSLKQEQIVGSPDMTPAAIKDEATKAGLAVDQLSFPTMSRRRQDDRHRRARRARSRATCGSTRSRPPAA